MSARDERAAQIKARVDHATLGPWEAVGRAVRAFYGFVVAQVEVRGDVEFIVHARADVPWLLGERDRLAKRVEALRDALQGMHDGIGGADHATQHAAAALAADDKAAQS